jgi:hypothetical protein
LKSFYGYGFLTSLLQKGNAMKSRPSFKLFDIINSLLLTNIPSHEMEVLEPSPSFAAIKIANHGYKTPKQASGITPSAVRDCSTYKFQFTSFLKFESHNKMFFNHKRIILIQGTLS